jgi:hypothetical protein
MMRTGRQVQKWELSGLQGLPASQSGISRRQQRHQRAYMAVMGAKTVAGQQEGVSAGGK